MNAYSANKANQQVTLSDGRKLGFAEYGDPNSPAILYFHGWPGSRLEAKAFAVSNTNLRVRVLSLDRPGYGLSDFKSDRRILDWPKDVSEFAEQLGLKRFAVVGVSGGGPYAAACGATIPERLSAVVLVCALGPTDAPGATEGMVAENRWMLSMAQTVPWLARTLVGFGLEGIRHRPEEFLPPHVEKKLPESDRHVLASGGFRQIMTESFREAFRSGVDGALWEGGLYAEPWGFPLGQIQVPVRLWHGESDIIVPPAMGRHYAREIANCRAVFYPGEGHFSLALNHMQEIIGCAITP